MAGIYIKKSKNIVYGKGTIDPAPPPPPPPPPPDPVTGVSPIYPPIVNTLTAKAAQNISYPPYLQWVDDDSFGDGVTRQIMRITDSSTFGTASQDHGYSKEQNWNADGSLMKINRRSLLDGQTFVKIKNLGTPSGITLWSHTDPAIMYVFGNSRIIAFNVLTNAQTQIYDFTSEGFDTTSVSVGSSEGNIDRNDEYVCLNFPKGSATHLIIFNLQTGTIASRRTLSQLGITNVMDWCTVSKSGNYIIISTYNSGTSGPSTRRVYRRSDWAPMGNINDGGSHRDLGFDVDGNEVITAMLNPFYTTLLTQTKVTLVSSTTINSIFGAGSGGVGGHSSCAAYNRLNWATFSSTTNGLNNPYIFSAKLTSSGTKEFMRWCHPRYTASDYDGECQATTNRDGSIILFTSDWNRGNGYSQSYVCRVKPSATSSSTLSAMTDAQYVAFQADSPQTDTQYSGTTPDQPLTDTEYTQLT